MTQLHLPLTPAWLGWANAWAFGLLLVLPLLWWLWSLARRRPVIRFSSLAQLRATSARSSGARNVLYILRSLALICLIVACARPQKADESSRIFAEGVAIQLVVDVSSSMGDYDLSPPDAKTKLDRLGVVKEIVRSFVEGDKDGALPGRANDLVGLIRFARYADSVCPLTLDHKNLVTELDATHWIGESLMREIQKMQESGGSSQRYNQLVDRFRQLNQSEDGTNIGAGLALAVERLKDLKRTTGSGEQLKINSRIVVLLTDGENNVEEIVNRTGLEPSLVTISPVQAGELAAKDGIKVYTIAAGTGALEQRYDMFGSVVRSSRRPLNDADLRKIAETTGGKHFVATDRQSLERIYEEIDKLERSKIEERSYVRWSELAWPWLLAAFAALSLQTLLDATRMRKIP